MQMADVSTLIKAFWAMLCALMLAVTGTIEVGAPEGAVLTETQTFVMTDALTRAQGVTTDGEYYYFSSNYFLIKTTLDGETVVKNLAAIPPELLKNGSNHIGGCSYYNGKIYTAIEDGDSYQNPYIVIFDALTLKYTGEKYLLPQELHIDGVPWCAADSERGYLYTAEWNHATVLNVFDLETMELVKTVPLVDEAGNTAELHRIQGSEIYDGTLYCSSDIEDTQPVYSVNPDTGLVTELFKRNLGDAEAEDLTILENDDGTFTLVSMDISRSDGIPVGVNIRKYVLN